MDIKGAKALKDRLGPHKAEEAPPATVDVPDDAPPVYQWLGVSRARPETPSAAGEDDSAGTGVSLFRRLGLSFR